MTIKSEFLKEKKLWNQNGIENVSFSNIVPKIRQYLLPYQKRQINKDKTNGFLGLIMKDSDITNIILSNTDLKFFFESNVQKHLLRRKNDQELDYI
jgi:cytidylate kinase